tara:strand:+ start:741 stop:1373 length:633 start_codon:yes stop_codon:yes gene_type:complete
MSEFPDWLPRYYYGFAYDENGCWSRHTDIELAEAECAFLGSKVQNQIIELDDDFIASCPPGLRNTLLSSPALTHLTMRVTSYVNHSNRELTMMLAGEKPLASFHVGPGEAIEDTMWRPQPFAPHVASGRIIRYETSFGRDPAEHGIAILFALPEETWRLKAYEALYKHCLTYKFSSYVEPLFGTLYGYTDEQNLEHVRIDARLHCYEWDI